MVRNQQHGENGKDGITGRAEDKGPVTKKKRSLVDRRSYLKLAGAAAAAISVPSVASQALASDDDPEITFDREVNIVEDFGADPTGGQSVNSAISQAARNGTLIVFPEGRYRFSGRVRLTDLGTVGFRGEGDVRFVVPQGFNDYLVNVEVGRFLFEGIDIDIDRNNTNAGLRVMAEQAFRVEDVELLGRGTHNSSTDTKNLLNAGVWNRSGVGIVRKLVAKKGSAWAHYSPRGKVGIHAGGRHRGTMRVIDCHLEEFGNNGMYTSRCPGNIQVIGGFFRNNNVSCIRISGEDSYVDGATVVVDPDAYTGPRTQEDRAFNMRGIVIESANAGSDKPPGTEIHNCEIVIKRNPTTGSAIHVWSNGRTAKITNTRIQMDNDRPAIRRDGMNYQGNNPPAEGPRWVRMENVQITGSSSGGSTLDIRYADGTQIENCCIHQSGSNRDGITLRNSSNCRIEDSVIDVSGEAIDLRSSSADTQNISGEGTCEETSLDGDLGSEEEETGSEEEETETEPETDLPHSLVIDGNGSSERTDYAFTVDGEVEQSEELSTYGTGGEIGEDGSVEGFVRGGSDGFRFDGEITSLTLSRDGATVSLDGEEVDPSEFGDGDDNDGTEGDDGTGGDDGTEGDDGTDGDNNDQEPLSRTLVIDGQGGSERRTYRFSVSGNIEQSEELSTYGTGGEIDEDGSVEGFVRGGSDGFRFDGDLDSFEIEDGPVVYVDGEEIDPSEVGGGDDVDEEPPLPHTIVIEEASDGSTTSYRFAVSGELEKGEHATEDDEIDGSVAIGTIQDGKDSYHFSGFITMFEVDGKASITFESGAE